MIPDWFNFDSAIIGYTLGLFVAFLFVRKLF